MRTIMCILISVLLVATLLSGCVESGDAATDGYDDVTLGALLPLTGNLESIGEASQASLKLAIEDRNNYVSNLGSQTRVDVVVKDTESDPETALEKLKELDEMGIKVVIGPQSSSEAKAVLDYANENGIILLSTASTAPSLAIPDDNLFRLVSDDTNQGRALARLMKEDGVTTVIPVYVNDIWGNELSAEVQKSFETLNGTVLEGVTYESGDTGLSAEIEALNENVVDATSESDETSVAVLLCSYGEVTEIFNLASDYPALSDVRWYGTDGVALDRELVNNESAASFAESTDFKASIYGYVLANDGYQAVEPRIEKELGRRPDPYGLTVYDALWIGTFIEMNTVSDDSESAQLATFGLTDRYYGINGAVKLNENGDRQYWDYDIWTITEENGKYQWVRSCKILLPYGDNLMIMSGEQIDVFSN